MKPSLITLRVDADRKERIAKAARTVGKSITNFMLEATMTNVERIETTTKAPSKANRGACPTFFRALCRTAQAGGEVGYDDAAYELMRHIGDQAPVELEDDEWRAQVHELEELLGPRNRRSDRVEEQVVAWFEKFLPRCMELVPTRRRPSFVHGIRRFMDDGEIDF